jgi:glutamyl-tRNA synthetase
MPREGQCRIQDLVRGEVVSEWAAEADHVVQRADGTCLYHLASVVDDVAMEISHVIRAEEHLSNTPRQIFIFQGLGATLPEFAHLPVVAEPGSRVKLSKRKLEKYLKNPEFAELYERGRRIAARLGHAVAAETFNPVIVDFYRESGFLPEAILNYLLLLGWSLDDRTEILAADERIAHFTLERVNRSAASFDPKKLLSFQERYMQALPVAARAELALPFLERAGWIAAPADAAARETTRAIVAAAGERLKVAGDVLEYDELFVADAALAFDEKAFDKRIRNAHEAPRLLAELAAELAAEPGPAFDAAGLEAFFQAFVAARGLGLGAIVHAVRVAVSGKAVGFGLWELLAIIGRERVLARLDRALARLGPVRPQL